MFSVKLKVKEDPRGYNSFPYRKKQSSISSSTSSLSRLPQSTPKKSSFLSNKNGKNNKKVRIQTSHELLPTSNIHGRCM